MPKVGKKHYAYTPKGKAAAKSRVKAVAVKGGDNVSVKDDQAVATAGSKKHG